MRTVKVTIEGKVQGVGFRYFTRQMAYQLELKGYVKNLPDGGVEAVFQGDDERVLKMLDWCEMGPPMAEIKNVEIDDYDGGLFESFVVET